MGTWTAEPTASSAESYDHTSKFESLRTNPLMYPGRLPKASFVYRRGLIWPLSTQPGQRATKARILWRDVDGRARRTPLANALLRWGATEVTARVPVLAIGSNGYPRQLFDKLRNSVVDDTIPSFSGTLSNIEIAFCPFVSGHGYVPVTPRHRPGAQSRAFLQLLSPSQLRSIAATERSYQLVSLHAESARFEIDDSCEILPLVYVFWHPEVLACFGDLPPICEGTVAPEAPPEVARRIVTHRELVERLLSTMLEADPDAMSDARVRRLLGDVLLRSAVANTPPSGSPIDATGELSGQYGDLSSSFGGESRVSGLRVRRTGPRRDKAGDFEALAHLHETDRHERGIRRDGVVFSTQSLSPDATRSLLATPVRVVSRGDARSLPLVGDVCLDQMARTAIGVSPGERCEIAPLDIPLGFRLARAFGRSLAARSLTGRAVRASEAVMERPICWIDPAMLDALGIGVGGQVVIAAPRPTGNPPRGFMLKYVRLQALAPSSEQIDERRAVSHPDDAGARFPLPSEILGILPDLPWIWIDEQARDALGLLQMHPTSPVIVRPSLRYLVLRAASRFVLATLGIGAGVSLAVYRIGQTLYPERQWLGVPVAEIASLSVLLLTLAAASSVIWLNAQRT